MSDFLEFQKILLEQNYDDLKNRSFSDPIINRIAQIDFSNKFSKKMYDFGVLLRQLLLTRKAQGALPRIKLKQEAANWGEKDFWKHSLLEVISLPKNDDIFIQSNDWNPDWLAQYQEEGADIFHDVYKGQKIRKNANLIMDPCLAQKTNYTHYTCPGQAEAVRSVMFMPEGSTLIINLPTGSGKTLAIQTPLILDGPEAGLTLVIVPTTALAIDQARQMKQLVGNRWDGFENSGLAFYGDLKDTAKNKIRERIRSGTQGILFTSPESATGSLAPAIWDACKKGNFKCLAIDEAHMVAGWGDYFRPEFQLLSGFRNGLLREAGGYPFKTLLLSATLTQRSIRILKKFYGSPGPIQMCSAVHLRPEPRYLSLEVKSQDEKEKKLFELLRFAPKPLILYLNSPHDVGVWSKYLSLLGSQRFTCFDGTTNGNQREEIINKWNKNTLDVLVATNAFGVGMDKSDVKTIVHGMVPDSLDQFYQEVGRGGRDGTACLSVAVFGHTDIERAKRKVRPSGIIGIEKSYLRWKSLYQSFTTVEELDLKCFNIANKAFWITQDSDENNKLNLRILIQMMRAGFLELNAISPIIPQKNHAESDYEREQKLKEFWENERNKIYVKILDGSHLDEIIFSKRVTDEATKSQTDRTKSFELLLAVLRGKQEMQDTLSELYSSPRSNIHEDLIIVSKTCRGCPKTPYHPPHISYRIPIGSGIKKTIPIDLIKWSQKFKHLGKQPIIIYPAQDIQIEQVLKKILNILVRDFNFKELVVSPQRAKNHWVQNLFQSSPNRRLVQRVATEKSDESNLPRVTLLDDRHQLNDILKSKKTYENINLFLIPDNAVKSNNNQGTIDTGQSTLELDRFMRKIE